MSRPDTASLAADIVERALRSGLRVTTAESCTGGLVASAITDVAGSSAVFGMGFVTYSNESKTRWLGVPSELLQHHGAVSREVAQAMAEGAAPAGMADLSVAVTGIAGPGGGSEAKPLGLVHFATWSRLGVTHLEQRFGDIGRTAVRSASTLAALELLSGSLKALIADEIGDQTGTEFE